GRPIVAQRFIAGKAAIPSASPVGYHWRILSKEPLPRPLPHGERGGGGGTVGGEPTTRPTQVTTQPPGEPPREGTCRQRAQYTPDRIRQARARPTKSRRDDRKPMALRVGKTFGRPYGTWLVWPLPTQC